MGLFQRGNAPDPAISRGSHDERPYDNLVIPETREFLGLLGVTKSFKSLKRLQEVEAYDVDYSALYQDPSGNLF